jgi:hypothetical protein
LLELLSRYCWNLSYLTAISHKNGSLVEAFIKILLESLLPYSCKP